MSDESGYRQVSDGPTQTEFEAAEEESQERGRSLFVRILRGIVALIVIVALVFYFVEPIHRVFVNVPFPWRSPDSGTRPIPLAPAPKPPAKMSS